MDEWRVIEDIPRDGTANMAIDRAILAACESSEVLPTLRLYSWERPTLTVGYAQNIDREIDFEKCLEQGIQVVRRPTGGRALLHHHEVTYSFTAPIPHPKFPPSLYGVYKVISQALIEGLVEVGVKDAVLASSKKAKKDYLSFHSPSCLSSINHWEIEVRGAKLVGSAQRRTKNAFLQQGSILIDCDRKLLNSLFKYKANGSRLRSMNNLNNKFITLSECLEKDVSCEEVSKALRKGFSRTLFGRWIRGSLSSSELVRCADYVDSKEIPTILS